MGETKLLARWRTICVEYSYVKSRLPMARVEVKQILN